MLAALAFNALPVIGVAFWGWSAFALIFLYWIENVIVGARTLLSMAATALARGGTNFLATLFFGAFFAVHYGIFCFGHGVFITLMFGQLDAANAPMLDATPFDLIGVAGDVFARTPDLVWGLAAIIGWQAMQFAFFLARGEARATDAQELMGAPYPRIFALHVTIIIGGALIMALGAPIWSVVVLALIKAGYDVGAALKSPRKAERTPGRRLNATFAPWRARRG